MSHSTKSFVPIPHAWPLTLIPFAYRMDTNVYGPICSDGWSLDWSDEVCAQMNYLGQVPESEFNRTLQESDYFLLNNSLTTDDVSHVQEARSNYQQSCDQAVNFQCQSYGKYQLASYKVWRDQSWSLHFIVYSNFLVGDRFLTDSKRSNEFGSLGISREGATIRSSLVFVKSFLPLHFYPSNEFGAIYSSDGNIFSVLCQ